MLQRLDNVVWEALTSDHAGLADGDGPVRRYAAPYTSLVGFQQPERPDFGALARCCRPGERLYCIGWSGTPAPGWQVEAETTIVKMVWSGGDPEADPGFAPRRLGPADVAAAQALAESTHPGPFGPRTIELGEYFGVDDDAGRLVAMAGERMSAAPWREISAVCTHPDHRGRGLAGRLMRRLVRRQRARGDRPFLHVMQANAAAVSLYRRLGFEVYREMVVRIVARID